MTGVLDDLLWIALTNAATATLLGAGVALASRWIKRPAIVHALWLFVFCDLVTPPVFKVGLLPVREGSDATTGRSPIHAAGSLSPSRTEDRAGLRLSEPAQGAPDQELHAATASVRSEAALAPGARAPFTVRRPGVPESVVTIPSASRARTSDARAIESTGANQGSVGARLRDFVATLWLGGTLVVLLLGARKLLLFRHRLRGADEVPLSMRDRASILAGVIGLRRAPRICLVRSRVSPLLWFRRWRLEILLPEPLLASLRAPETDALLLHELAHVKRHDHWVRVLEFCASAAFWWHPLVYWSRGRMRQAEEQACDAWVLSCAPGRGQDYATGLLKTVEFLAGARPRPPALAQGLGTYRLIEERLTMILDDHTPKQMSRLQTAALVGFAGVLLLAFPTRAARSSTIRASERAATVVASSAPRAITPAASVTATTAPMAGTPAASIAASSTPAVTATASSAPLTSTPAANVTAATAQPAGTGSDEERSTDSEADRIARLEREIERLVRELEEARGQHASRDALEQYRKAIGAKVRNQADYEAAIAAQLEVERSRSNELDRARQEMMQEVREKESRDEEAAAQALALLREAQERQAQADKEEGPEYLQQHPEGQRGRTQDEIGSQLRRMRDALSELQAATGRLSAEQSELRRAIETLKRELGRLRAKTPMDK